MVHVTKYKPSAETAHVNLQAEKTARPAPMTAAAKLDKFAKITSAPSQPHKHVETKSATQQMARIARIAQTNASAKQAKHVVPQAYAKPPTALTIHASPPKARTAPHAHKIANVLRERSAKAHNVSTIPAVEMDNVKPLKMKTATHVPLTANVKAVTFAMRVDSVVWTNLVETEAATRRQKIALRAQKTVPVSQDKPAKTEAVSLIVEMVFANPRKMKRVTSALKIVAVPTHKAVKAASASTLVEMGPVIPQKMRTVPHVPKIVPALQAKPAKTEAVVRLVVMGLATPKKASTVAPAPKIAPAPATNDVRPTSASHALAQPIKSAATTIHCNNVKPIVVAGRHRTLAIPKKTNTATPPQTPANAKARTPAQAQGAFNV